MLWLKIHCPVCSQFCWKELDRVTWAFLCTARCEISKRGRVQLKTWLELGSPRWFSLNTWHLGARALWHPLCPPPIHMACLFTRQWDPQSERMEVAKPCQIYGWKSSIVSFTTFYWLMQVTRAVQTGREENDPHFLEGDTCVHSFSRNCWQLSSWLTYVGIVGSERTGNKITELTSTPAEVRSTADSIESWNNDVEDKHE